MKNSSLDKTKVNQFSRDNILILVSLVLISTSLLTGGFIYPVHDDNLDQDNELVKAGATKGHLYFMFGIVSFMISSLFWGFIMFAGEYMGREQ